MIWLRTVATKLATAHLSGHENDKVTFNLK